MKDIIPHMPKTLSFSKRIVKYFPQAIRRRLPASIAIVGVAAKESAAFNRRYRRKNKATNVLSFRYSKEYGEIILCPVVIRREAKAQGHSYKYQMTWMILHGMIHLAGVHHEASRADAERVEKTERRILNQIFGEKKVLN